MASLQSLPEELLIEIVVLFEHDRVHLRSLSLVSRRIHAIARKFLFRHVGIEINRDSKRRPPFDDSKRVAQAHLLERSFSENSSLRKLVWTYGPVFLKRHFAGRKLMPFCTILVDQKEHWEPTFYATGASVNSINSFPNLKELWFSCTDTEDEAEAGKHTEMVFDRAQMSGLSTIKIHGGGVELLSCMRLPNIREVVTTYFHLPRSDMPSRLQQNRTSVRRLEIVGHECDIPIHHFTQLMTICPQLEDLKVNGKLNVHFWGYPPLEFTFHTAGVLDALNLVRHNLKSLELIIPPRGIIENEEAPLDLSQFHGLVHLRISGLFLFPFGDPLPSRKDVHRLLPQNLRSLQIDCPPQAGFARPFWSYRNELIPYDPKTDTVSLPLDRYDWIFQFTTFKERFPHLWQLALLDDEFRDGEGPGRCSVEWRQPEDVKKTFKAAGINLEVRIILWNDHPGLPPKEGRQW